MERNVHYFIHISSRLNIAALAATTQKRSEHGGTWRHSEKIQPCNLENDRLPYEAEQIAKHVACGEGTRETTIVHWTVCLLVKPSSAALHQIRFRRRASPNSGSMSSTCAELINAGDKVRDVRHLEDST